MSTYRYMPVMLENLYWNSLVNQKLFSQRLLSTHAYYADSFVPLPSPGYSAHLLGREEDTGISKPSPHTVGKIQDRGNTVSWTSLDIPSTLLKLLS